MKNSQLFKRIIEYKTYNKFGHIEDVVVDKDHRNKGIGKLLINSLVDYGIKNGCYKISLNASCELSKFYTSNGFNVDGNHFDKFAKFAK